MLFSDNQAKLLLIQDDDRENDSTMPVTATIGGNPVMLANWMKEFNPRDERVTVPLDTFKVVQQEGYQGESAAYLYRMLDGFNEHKRLCRATLLSFVEQSVQVGDNIQRIKKDKRFTDLGANERVDDQVNGFVDIQLKTLADVIRETMQKTNGLLIDIKSTEMPEPSPHQISIDGEIRTLFKNNPKEINNAFARGFTIEEVLAVIRGPASLSGMNAERYEKLKADYYFLAFFAEAYQMDIYSRISLALWTAGFRVLTYMLGVSGKKEFDKDKIRMDTGFEWGKANLLDELNEASGFIELVNAGSSINMPNKLFGANNGLAPAA